MKLKIKFSYSAFQDDATAFNNLKKAKVEGKGVLNNRSQNTY